MDTMNRETRFSSYSSQGTRRVVSIWQTAASQPSWISRIVLMTFVFVIAVPLVLLALLAFFAATLVFVVLRGVNAVNSVRAWFSRLGASSSRIYAAKEHVLELRAVGRSVKVPVARSARQ